MVQRPVLIASAARDPFVSDVKRILQSEGWEVVGLHSTEAARRAVRAKHPALVVLDTMLPGGDALSLCQQWKSDPATAEMPVFFFSVLMARDRCMEAGADGFMLKPIEQEQLLAHLRDVLNSRITPLRRRAR